MHADFGRHPAQDEIGNALLLQALGQIGVGKCAVAGFVDHAFRGQGAQLVDEIVAPLAAHQQAAERPRAADGRAGTQAALQLLGRAVGQVGQVTLAGVKDRHSDTACRGQESLNLQNRPGQARHVKPGAVGIATRRAEVTLHVNHQQRAAGRIEARWVGQGLHAVWPADSRKPLRIACAMRSATSSAIKRPLTASAPRAEDSTPEAGTQSMRGG